MLTFSWVGVRYALTPSNEPPEGPGFAKVPLRMARRMIQQLESADLQRIARCLDLDGQYGRDGHGLADRIAAEVSDPHGRFSVFELVPPAPPIKEPTALEPIQDLADLATDQGENDTEGDHWITFQVVDDISNQPLPDATFELTLATGDETQGKCTDRATGEYRVPLTSADPIEVRELVPPDDEVWEVVHP